MNHDHRYVSSYPFRLFLLVVLIFIPATAGASQPVLHEGDAGQVVLKLQDYLYVLGDLDSEPSGIFDAVTSAAVRQFQHEQGLLVDGIVGQKTWQRIEQVHESIPQYVVESGDTLWALAAEFKVDLARLVAANRMMDPESLKVGQTIAIPVPTVVPLGSGEQSEKVLPVAAQVQPTRIPRPVPLRFPPKAGQEQELPEMTPWNEASKIFPHASVAVVTDVKTGYQFRVRRYYGHYHADVEPLTATDTEVMKRVYGEWSWERRPIVVEVGGKRMAASMNGMPHGDGIISTNRFPGHFCIHFLNSRIHRTGNIDEAHQAAVRAAARYQQDSNAVRQ